MERRDAQNRTGASKALVIHYQLLSSYSEAEDVPYQGDALNFFHPPSIHQKQIGANKVAPTDHPIPSHFEYPERLAGAPGALIFFRPPFIYQKQTGANKVTPTDNPIPSHFEYSGRLAGAPGALIFFCLLFFHQGKKRRSEDRQVTHPIRGTYKGAYAFAPYPAGRKKNLCLSGLPRLIHFKKTYTSHQPIPIKKINRRPSGFPLPIHFSNIVHHTLCFSFK